MRHLNKDRLLQEAKEHINQIRKKIEHLLPGYRMQIERQATLLPKLTPEDKYIAEGIIRNLTKQAENLDALHPSPYFIKCIVKFDTDTTDRIFYFAKFPFQHEHIYSWTAPAAALRFSDIGPFTYKGGDGLTIKGTLSYKEQYLISNGKLIFMAAESATSGRELIYQEHFSTRKTEFALPEIVEQMEAAQDKAIRTPAHKNMLIAGPAGSGKTTLALHRVAYLLQAPDTAERFTAKQTLVLVNDHGTKAYFGKLLPELGITHVAITTFGDFVLQELQLTELTYATETGAGSFEQNLYAYEKHRAIAQLSTPPYSNPWSLLEEIYAPNFSKSSRILFAKQKEQKIIDRFDATILLEAFLKANNGLTTFETQFSQLKNGRVKRTKQVVPKIISLLVLDEVQNYTSKQLEVLQKLLAPTGSCVYVGDLAQQTKLFTVRDWNSAGVELSADNTVVLSKVYRSTKQILDYIRSKGYPIAVPEQCRNGAAVQEISVSGEKELLHMVEAIIFEHPGVTIGILTGDKKIKNTLEQHIKTDLKIKILTIAEAQGVEFDIVLLCEPQTKFLPPEQYPKELAILIEQVEYDLRYVALTRAMNALYVLQCS